MTKKWLIKVDMLAVLRRNIAAIFVLPLQVLILDESLLRGVLLFSALRDLLVLFGDLALFELGQLLLVFMPRTRLILALRVKFALEYFRVGQLMRIIGQRVVPSRPCI